MRASEHCFHLVMLVRPFTCSLPTRIASIVDKKQSSKPFLFCDSTWKLSGGYFICLMIGSYVCGLNSELSCTLIVFFCC